MAENSFLGAVFYWHAFYSIIIWHMHQFSDLAGYFFHEPKQTRRHSGHSLSTCLWLSLIYISTSRNHRKKLRAPRVTLMSLFAIRIWIQGIDQFGKLLYRILGSGLRTVTTAALNLQLEQTPQMPASIICIRIVVSYHWTKAIQSYCFSGPLCLYQECLSRLFVDASHVAFYE